MPPRRHHYTAKFKLEVIRVAEDIGNWAAARQFSIGEASVRDWRKQKSKLEDLPPTKKACTGPKAKYPELEKKLVDWVLTLRAAGRGVTSIKIRAQAEIFKDEMQIENFKASPSWVVKFRRRNNLVIRRRTTVGQALPADYEEKRRCFHSFVRRHIAGVPLQHVGNFDEVPMSFDAPENRTVDVRGAQTVSITTTGHEKTGFTVGLCCLSSGDKLKPMLIFKRKTAPREVLPNTVFVRWNEKGWMTSELMHEWIDEVWRKRAEAFFSPKSVLVMDSMQAHKTENVLQHLRKCKTTPAVIPGGLTKLLQPLDIAVNRSFKAGIRHQWEAWMNSGMHTFTNSGHMRRAPFATVCEWVANAWREVPVSAILSGFRKAGITSDEAVAAAETSSSEDEDELDAPAVANWMDLFHSDDDSDEEFEGF